MNTEEIIIEFQKLDKKQNIFRWIVTIFALMLVGMAVYLIGNHEFGYRNNFSLGNAILPIGGVLLGYTFRNWSGNSAHKLLRKLILNISGASDRT